MSGGGSSAALVEAEYLAGTDAEPISQRFEDGDQANQALAQRGGGVCGRLGDRQLHEVIDGGAGHADRDGCVAATACKNTMR